MTEQSLAGLFKETASLYGDKIAIQHHRDELRSDISFDTLRKDVEHLSAFLLAEGISKGDRLAILLENRPEWPLIFFASVSIGAVPVPFNPDSNVEEIENILRDSECKIMFTSAGPLLEKASSAQCKSLKETISVDSERFKDALRTSAKPSAEKIGVLPSDLACLLYTSGTTDEPKGVMLSHRNLLSNSESLYSLNLVTQKDNIISVLPLHHAYPLTVTMLLPLLYGARIIYPESSGRSRV